MFFVDEGPPVVALLRAAALGVPGGYQVESSKYMHRLLAAFDETSVSTPVREGPTKATHGLLEPLSKRERDVLQLLGTDLDGPDIARELVVSLNTVRTHTKNIYAKLGVNNRRAAVRRAAELDLLSTNRGR